jgi:transglutaminase/protease-like cytokinesis protein 3
MLLKKSFKLYSIIILLAAVLILSVNAIAQTKVNKLTNKKQVEKKPIPQKKHLKQNAKLQEGLSSSLELSNKISELEGELSRTKTTLFAEQQESDELYNKVRMLTTSLKNLQAVVNQKNTELVMLKDAHEKYTDVITCYRTALSAWDNQLRTPARTGPDHIILGTELRSAISMCPSI